MDHDAVEQLFTFVPPVDEQIDDTKPLELLGASAASFAHDLVDLVSGKPLREAIVKLQAVVQVTADGIREAARRRDRGLALSGKAEAQHP